MLSSTPATVNLDGRNVPPASMLTKGVAVAVDLCLTVSVAALAFYLISTRLPLDDAAARTPIWAVLGLALAYLVIGRDHVFSPGRQLLRLVLVRLPGNVPGLFGRSISVHMDEEPDRSPRHLTRPLLVVTLASVLAVLGLGGALTTTRLYTTVKQYVLSGEPVSDMTDRVESLSTVPRALLMNRKRGYVQVDGKTGSGRVTLEVFTVRDGVRWRVVLARPTTSKRVADYSLGAPESDIPLPPGHSR